MLTCTPLRTLILCALLTVTTILQAQHKALFTFKLTANANTSAGVFTQNGVLVKTLWAGVKYSAGTYTETWDGTDDDGHLVTGSGYNVRVLSNNVNYQWEGVIGNTSSAMYGPTVNHSFQGIYGMAFYGAKAYYCTNYSEQQPPIFTFNIKNPQAKTSILGKGGATAFVATDGNYVYWDGTDANDTSKTYVYATKASDNSEVTNFAKGVAVKVTYSRTYSSAIDAGNNVNSRITGLAVQKNGNYLLVSHQHLNQIHVLHKGTGALVKVITIASPKGLAVDNSNNVWVISGGAVLKYTLNADGSFSAPLVSITNLTQPLAIAVNVDGSTIAVADGGVSQQIKAFSAAAGKPMWVYGAAGGYATDAAVTTAKFYFADRDAVHTFMNFTPDGSFWVGDPGNCRALHFSANRVFIEQLMYLPHFYSCVADPNNPSRVFADFLEFKIDYSKPLSPTNGSWALVKNWGYNITSDYSNQYFIFRSLTTLSNGHTYAFLRHGGNLALVELPAKGLARYTSVELLGLNYELCQDGSLRTQSAYVADKPTVWTTQKLTGFDKANDPIWAPPTVIASSPPATANDPAYYGSGNSVITSSGIIVLFDGGLPPNGSSGYHLGGIKTGGEKWLWRTAKATSRHYNGPYPTDGAYDIGNHVQYAGSHARAIGRTIIWGYYGEFWKNSEVNKWTQVYDDGLFIGQFGVAANTYPDAAPMMAGNAFAVSCVKDSAGNSYVYLNDESYHSGMHRWKITGLNTIAEQTIPVNVPNIKHGLLAQYFSGNDLNIFNLKATDIDTSFGNTAKALNSVKATNNFSVRWSGFIKPNATETYTFYATANKGLRLWIDGRQVINEWNNPLPKELSGTALLTAGQWHPLTMEYMSAAKTPVTLQWSSAGLNKQVVPSKNLYSAAMPDTIGGTNLMEGLPFEGVLENNLHGWGRNPASEDSTNIYSKWWSVKTGTHTYSRHTSPDVYASFTQSSGTYTLTRDLGTNATLSSWKLSGNIDYFGNNENDPSGKGGQYFEVLDAAGKIICRFYIVSIYNPTDPALTIYGNTAVITHGGRNVIGPVIYYPQPINISAAKGIITFTYGPYAPVKANIFDASSNWQSPKTMRIYFFGNGANYGRVIDIRSMRFLKN